MARSARLKELERRVRELRVHLLPQKFDPTGSYSARIIDRARAYRLLTHAEIEACIEDLVLDVIDRQYKAWEIDRKPRTCLLAVVSFYADAKLSDVPETLPPTLSKTTPGFLKARLETARSAYKRRVAANNGIKERDILRLLLPVG